MLQRIFRPRVVTEAGQRLYAGVADQARQPALYRDLCVPDRIDSRFELYILHAALVLLRLKGQGPQAEETSQALFHTFVSQLDDTLRELGVGDLSVGKKMRKLGEAMYGRFTAYDSAIDDPTILAAAVRRNVYGDAPSAKAEALASYVGRARAALAAQPLERLLKGEADWPEVTA